MGCMNWDDLADKFDASFIKDPLYVNTLGKMVELASDLNRKDVLDLGCGPGNLIRLIREKFPEAKVAGIDPSPRMRELCTRRFDDNSGLRIKCGEALQIPFPDNSFDCLMSSLALHHIPPEKRGDCAREISRVLKPGKCLVYADVFCDVDGPPDDPERCRDIIMKMVNEALYSMEHGAYEKMLMVLEHIPVVIREDGEYITTLEKWTGVLGDAGFTDLESHNVSPAGHWFKIIRGRLADATTDCRKPGKG